MSAILTKKVMVAVLWGGRPAYAELDYEAGSCVLLGGQDAFACLMIQALSIRCLGLHGLVSMFEDN